MPGRGRGGCDGGDQIVNDNTDCSLAARANASSLIILLNRFVIPLPLPSPRADNIYPTVGFINVCHSRALISLAPSAMVFKPDQGRTEEIIIHNLQRDTHCRPRPPGDLG